MSVQEASKNSGSSSGGLFFFKKDNLVFGLLMGLIAPVLGLVIFKVTQFSVFTVKEYLQYLYLEPGYRKLTAALSVSLLLNALFFTIYINTRKDQTAKGIFITTLIYGLIVLIIKTFA